MLSHFPYFYIRHILNKFLVCQWGRHYILGALQSCVNTEAVVWRCSAIRMFLNISPHTCNFFKKKDSKTGVFLWILRNFQDHFFYRTPPVVASVNQLFWKTEDEYINSVLKKWSHPQSWVSQNTTRKLWQKAKLRKVAPSGPRQFLATKSPLKKMKNVFLFRLESSFRSWDISNFVLSFWSCRETAW